MQDKKEDMCPRKAHEQLDDENTKSKGQNQAGPGLQTFHLPNTEPKSNEKVSVNSIPPARQGSDVLQSLENIKLSADMARQAHNNEAAIRYYNLALAMLHQQPGQADLITEYNLLAGREICYSHLGLYSEQRADLDIMKQLAFKLDDVPRQIQVVTSQVKLDNILGNFENAQFAARAGLDLARQSGSRALEAECLASLGITFNSLSDYANAQVCYADALSIYRESGDTRGEALCLKRMGDCLNNMGQLFLAQEHIEQSLSMYHALGDQEGQAGCLNILGIISKDQARARSYYERSLEIFQAIGNRPSQANLYNNLGLVYWNFGLYNKARDYLERAVQTVREIQGRTSLASLLESLGRIYIELGRYNDAQKVLKEGLDLSRNIGDRLAESTYLMMLGRVELASGDLKKARGLFQKACDMQREMGTLGYLVTSLAWLGAAYLQAGNRKKAQVFSLEAIEQLNLIGRASEYPTQYIWWLHYQVLKAGATEEARSSTSTTYQEKEFEKESWKILARAREAMLAGIATLSDDSLRRNYLNKVKVNQDILLEWVAVSAKQKTLEKQIREGPSTEAVQNLSIEPERTHERLNRLLDISLQMNETLNPAKLLDFVMDNVIELSGAERGFLALVNEAGELDFQAERGLDQEESMSTGLQKKYPVLEKVVQTKTPVLMEDEIPDDLNLNNEKLLLNLRSAMCLPLLRRSELIGLIYADNRSISGRFSRADLEILSIFANQAATAIENSRLFRDRERRITELSILDEISRSLSSTLNLDELLETVYQQVGRIFDVTNFFIATYHEGDTEWVPAFQMDKGQRQPGMRHELGHGLTGYILRNPKPLLLHSSFESQAFKETHRILQVGEVAKSWMGVPLKTADKVVGVMGIQSYDFENLYDAHALNLFSTISAQVAIAIRNTRLYEEKSRANQELESFSYSVSHDLRAPIRTISGFSRILLEDYSGSLDSEGKKHLVRVSEAGRRMGELIDDILRLSRVTRSEIRRSTFDLSQVAQNVINDLQNAHQERQVEVIIHPGMKVNADLNLMRIMLENLLGNAWKFTQRHHSARIELGVTNKDNKVIYFVSDNGAGFDMAYADKLFGAFQRLHDSTEFEGTGIGLATVQRIIHRHGGVVWAEAAVEQGATFYFTLAR